MADIPDVPFFITKAQADHLIEFNQSITWDTSSLDGYALTLFQGNVNRVKKHFTTVSREVGISEALKFITEKRFGPFKVPIFNFLLQLTVAEPSKRKEYIDIIQYLAFDRTVVNLRDKGGWTAFMNAISLQPYWEPRVARIMLSAGANLNGRNRRGCTVACAILQCKSKEKLLRALKWFVDYGGDLDIRCCLDDDGVGTHSARKTLAALAATMPELIPFCQEDRSSCPRCAVCNAKKFENKMELSNCLNECGLVKYCSDECMQIHWRKHIAECLRYKRERQRFLNN